MKPFEACFIPEPDGPAVELTFFDGSTVRPVGFIEPEHAETDADQVDGVGPTRVGHWKKDDCDVYVGRAGPDGEIHQLYSIDE